MKRPLWFRRRGLHWTPCSWQGWLLVGVLSLFIFFVVLFWAPTSPLIATLGTFCMIAVVIIIASLTDDTHQPSR